MWIILVVFLLFVLILGLRWLFFHQKGRKRAVFVNNSQLANYIKPSISQIMNQVEHIRQQYYPKGRLYAILSIVLGGGSLLILCFVFPIFANDMAGKPSFWIIMISLFILFTIGLVFTSKYEEIKNRYDVHFKSTNVIPNAIKYYNPNLIYHSYDGYSEEEYKNCYFLEGWDRYFSGDGVSDSRTGFFCADVKTEVETEDEHGNRGYIITFSGSLARIPIPNCNCEIILGGIKSKDYSIYLNHVQFIPVEFESDIFNKLYTSYATNQIEAYRVITPDIIEQLVHLKQNTFGDIDVRIKNNYLYVRFNSGDGFVPNLLNRKKEEESVVASIAVLDEVYRTTQNIKNILERKIQS